jgi:orotate phosphoribosyltransferase
MPVDNSHETRLAAQALIDVDAIRVSTGQPFFYTSGWASPVYIDVRALMSDVMRRTQVMDIAAASLRHVVARQGITAVVGAEASGMVFAAWLAERLALPMLYLRKRPVGWGVSARIEGRLAPGARVLLVDDVTTDARSKLDACLALRQAGAQVHDVWVLVNFDIYPRRGPVFDQHQLALHSLLTWPRLFEVYEPQAPLSPLQRNELMEFTSTPVAWSIHHGGSGE